MRKGDAKKLSSSLSMTALPKAMPAGDVTASQRRGSQGFHKNTSLVLETFKHKIKKKIDAVSAKAKTSIVNFQTEIDALRYLLVSFEDLKNEIIAKRTKIKSEQRHQLDLFIYQNCPVHLVYLYCEAIMKDQDVSFDRAKWFVELMQQSNDKIANSLVYIANLLAVKKAMAETVMFREDSLANVLSVAYAQTSYFLQDLIKQVTAWIRSQPNWPEAYNIDAIDCDLCGTQGNNFIALLKGMLKIIAKLNFDPAIYSIITIRYDLVLAQYDYDSAIAQQAVISLFWMRIFLPLFRTQEFKEDELPIIKRLSALLIKVSSNATFDENVETDGEINKYFNNIIGEYLQDALIQYYKQSTEKKIDIKVFKFLKNDWEYWSSLLITDDLSKRVSNL